jgi:hypothetical protein
VAHDEDPLFILRIAPSRIAISRERVGLEYKEDKRKIAPLLKADEIIAWADDTINPKYLALTSSWGIPFLKHIF